MAAETVADYKPGELTNLFAKKAASKSKKKVNLNSKILSAFQKSVVPKKTQKRGRKRNLKGKSNEEKEQTETGDAEKDNPEEQSATEEQAEALTAKAEPENKNVKGQKASDEKKKSDVSPDTANDGAEDKEKNKRTIFIGNVPVGTKTKKKLKRLLEKECGPVESVRLRAVPIKASAIPSNSSYKVMRKVSVNKGNFDMEAGGENASCIAYAVFKNLTDAVETFKVFGTKSSEKTRKSMSLDGHKLRIDLAESDEHSRVFDRRRTVFVGNLPFSSAEETVMAFINAEMRKKVKGKGPAVEAVRLVRDKSTNLCKGIGYILLSSTDLLETALLLDGKLFEKRKLRVNRCERSEKLKKKNDKKPGSAKGSSSNSFEGARTGKLRDGAKIRLRKKKNDQLLKKKNTVSKRKRNAQKESRKERQFRKKQKKENKTTIR
mmetsp:Transcript_7472/g.9756  ORF Transcript_7472/g.9756 Transcript_7472/m.9756 type:complete len:434 (-) Transcript_7472:104-1405(-)